MNTVVKLKIGQVTEVDGVPTASLYRVNWEDLILYAKKKGIQKQDFADLILERLKSGS